MKALALTASDRLRLQQSGAIVSKDTTLDEYQAMWQAAIKKARAAFDELAFAERRYLAACERHRVPVPMPMPKIDPYSTPNAA